MAGTIERIADKLSKHQVVPFFGAGCSFLQLNVDWDGLCKKMNESTGSDTADNLTAAKIYVEQFGKESFSQFLESYLIVSDVDDKKVESYLFLLGLGFLAAYTTNQDNVFEKTAQRYGRRYNIVYNAKTIAEVIPKYPTLYKYHGDLCDPASIVFTTQDYNDRITNVHRNSLDIRLRSDLLGRTLLFLGYSFRDPNVKLLLRNLKALFADDMPESFLIQYFPDNTFAKNLMDEYGVLAVDCSEEIPDTTSPGEAFQRYLKKLSDLAISMRQAAEIDDMFTPSAPPGRRIVSSFEISGIKETISQGDLSKSIAAFRSNIDGSGIPKAYELNVKETYTELCRLATSPEHAYQLCGALFNLELQDSKFMLECYAACIALGNIVPSGDLGHNPQFHPITKKLSREADVIAFARAIEFLRTWGRSIDAEFYHFVSFHNSSFLPRNAIPDSIYPYLTEQFGFAYFKGKTTYENPLTYANRVNTRKGSGQSFQAIQSSIINMIPKDIGRPYGP